jgi:FtsH-binding integral membrane protein
MAKAVHLGTWFLLGCIASSAVAWLGALHPALTRVMWIIYILCGAALVVALLTDDAVRPFLKLSEPDYYALLIAIAFSIVLGGVIQWLLGG